ncbi:MAG TPA: GH92 family glycosyl hydrolase [Chitinophagaceae bacterium]|nr:GH92 family glycosyl hydrolase [Chitinophagaceae bacterium]
MKKIVHLSIILFFLSISSFAQNQKQFFQYVNPFIGTGGHGHTFPGATMPYGACQLSPDTRLEGWDGCSAYHYSDSIIYGFSHTHLSGTGCSDYGDILLMPTNKMMDLDHYQYASTFSHLSENAHAGYYQVFLEQPQVQVELTATLHGGIHKYSYQNQSPQFVVLNLNHRDAVIDSRINQKNHFTINGFRFSKAWATNQKLFYEIQFSKPIKKISYLYPKDKNDDSPSKSKSLYCLIEFEHQKNTNFNPKIKSNELVVKCAISGVDELGAQKNLSTEMTTWDFDFYKKKCEQTWNQELGKIKILDKETQLTEDKWVTFYTALYHCMIHPSIYSDVDGRYRGRDDKIHNTQQKFDYYTVFSLWDTYRALHPLLTILDSKRTNDFINTFIRQYQEGGRLPIWELSSNETNCMIGYHVVSVIWDAYEKGIRDYNIELAFEAMKSIASQRSDYEGEGLNQKLKESAKAKVADAEALNSYCKYGYVRSDDSHESVSKTLEYAYNDWCIAQMAKALGKENDYLYYIERSSHWVNIFDSSTGFMRAKKNGSLYFPFSPYTVDNNYTEANAWQYSFYVPHDINGLIMTLNGRQNLEKKLDDLFQAKEQTEGRTQADITGLIGQYAHGNEPSHHIAYLYNYTLNKSKTTLYTNKIFNEFYTNNPDGLIGNEDCGQMSAWYVFNALGLYPTCPGNHLLDIAEPQFNHLKINDSIDIIKKDNPSLHDKYFSTTQNKSQLSFDAFHSKQPIILVANNHLENLKELTTNPHEIKTIPYLENASQTFKDSLLVEIKSLSNSPIFYSINNESQQKYQHPIQIIESTTLHFFAENTADKIQEARFTKLPSDRKIILKNQYNPSYHGGGADGLIDGINGKLNWRAGDWQGYQGQDVEIVMEFAEPKSIKKLGANFLEDQNSWIFYPKAVCFYVSKDSVNWTLIDSVETNKPGESHEVSISKFEATFYEINPEKYKYAKMIAKNFGPMPAWHEGRGHPTFIFIDEFEVK